MTTAGAVLASIGAAMRSGAAWAGAAARAGMVGIEAIIISADITTIVVPVFIPAVPAAPECTMAGVGTEEVVTAAAMAVVPRAFSSGGYRFA
ncbi:MAG: hypothetical protein NTAFB05_12570 [Nitrobacter sp.]